MIADILKQKKEEKGLTTETLSKLSGVPVGTINKILNGETKSPRYDTLIALERILMDRPREEAWMFRDASATYDYKGQGSYTVEDYRLLPDDVRAELIDGELIYMEAPQTDHQMLVSELMFLFHLFIRENKGECFVFPAPLDVQLDCDERTMLQPDIAVICKKERLVKKGVYGAPDMVIEITSPSTRKMDYSKKVTKYLEAGVREYWIVDLQKRKIVTYFFEDDSAPSLYTFQDKVPVQIYEGKLEIDFSELEQKLKNISD